MRTPNVKCCMCENLLYRRPAELKKVDFVSCKPCYGEALKKFGSGKHTVGLEKGRGWNKGLSKERGEITYGEPRSLETKVKMSHAAKQLYKNRPELLKERGLKIRGVNHYRWKGGISNLNASIRLMSENRKWMDAVKERDGKCQSCGTIDNLESHHIVTIAEMIERYDIKSREDARNCQQFWDISNGITLCRRCHYKLHGRTYNED